MPETITPGGSLTIQVVDSDLNILSSARETVVVEVSNDRSGEVEQVVLIETGVNTGIFNTSLPTLDHEGTGTNNDGTLQLTDGDNVTTTYHDQLDSSGNSQDRTDANDSHDNGNDSGNDNDRDGDGVADSDDLDDDNDGIPDIQEGNGIVDTDGDGVADSFDLMMTV
jgi:TATA-binding protein-associated factor Taf7